MSRGNRVMLILDAMSVEERLTLFEEIGETYCVNCGVELPDEDSKEPDHDCPEDADDDDGDDGDAGDPDAETDDTDENEQEGADDDN